MVDKEVYKKILPYLEGYTEGINWDFKKTLSDKAGIIKDILAFSNSNVREDSYIIVGVSETNICKNDTKIRLDKEDRIRLNTDANYIYIPKKWDVHGMSAADLEKMKQFSAQLSEQISSSMLISHPHCEYVPISIGKSRWLYVIVVRHKEGVFLSKKDLANEYNLSRVVVKQGVLYVRIADTTIGAKTEVASASEHIRIWKNYIEFIGKNWGGLHE